MAKTITSAERDKILKLFDAGKTARDISKATGRPVETVRLVLRREGKWEPRRNRRISRETEAEVVRLYKTRIGARAVARQTGLHDPTYVYTILKRNGVAAHSTNGTRAKVGDTNIDSDGYVSEKVGLDWPYLHEMPGQGSNGTWIRQHRKRMAEVLGRALLPSEQVHHKDGNRTNNELSNLQLRQGAHGSGVQLRCRCCGSTDLEAVSI